MTPDHFLACSGLTKSFDSEAILRGVNLHADAGQLLALLGASGCGKTTTLRLIAGFEWPDAGRISLNGRVVAGDGVRVPAEARQVGMVFQEYALFPHVDVAGNVGFGLNTSKRDKQARVDEMLELVGLGGLAERMPHELSGGQQQRVALARALAPKPDALLLDEPFSNLDATLRMQVRSEIRAILKQTGTTGIFVTHDQQEAFSLADVVAVMFKGQVAQMDAPERLYHHPNSKSVAAFVGEANFLLADAKGDYAECVLGRVFLAGEMGGRVELLVRPEDVTLAVDEDGQAVVLWREFYGHDQRVGVRLSDGTTLIARAPNAPIYTADMRVRIRLRKPLLAFPAG